MSGLIVFLLQTFCYKETGLHHSRGKPLKLSRAYPQQLAARLHGVNPFSPLPLCKPFQFACRPSLYPCYLDLLTKNTSHVTTNKQRMETRHFCHGQMCGAWHTMRVGDGTRGNRGDGIVEASWSGQDWQWSL